MQSLSTADRAGDLAPELQDKNAIYLDLMKRVLLDTIYADDLLANFVLYRPKPHTKLWKRRAITAIERLLAQYQIKLVEPYSTPWIGDLTKVPADEQKRLMEFGQIWPVRAHTMIGLKRLENLQFCAETALRDRIPGDLIETGVWRGGACIFMRAILKAYGDTSRKVWVADSFLGLPPPDASSFPTDAGDKHHTYGDFLSVSRQQVENNFRAYGLLDDQVQFLQGWFKDTLPNAPIEQLSVLRLDGDMYESTIQALDALYDKLAVGGFLIVDDYELKPCAKAIHDFRSKRGIRDEILDIDGAGVYWRRSS